MTIVAAISNGKRAWIGADSASTHSETGIIRYDTDKLIRVNEKTVIGYSGNHLGITLLRDSVAMRHMRKARGLYELAGEIAHVLRIGGIEREDADILVATPGQIYGLWEGNSISAPDNKQIVACGSGARFAIGAGNVLLRLGKKTEVGKLLLSDAIQEACRWANGCGGAIQIIEVK